MSFTQKPPCKQSLLVTLGRDPAAGQCRGVELAVCLCGWRRRRGTAGVVAGTGRASPEGQTVPTRCWERENFGCAPFSKCNYV